MKPRSAQIFMRTGAVLWLLVTATAIVVVAQAPTEHAGLGLGLLLVWVVLIIFAAFARMTEYIGRRPR